MKKFLFTALFTLIGTLAFSQERVAVFPFEDMDNVFTRSEAFMFYDEFSNEFRNRSRSIGGFSVVPRQDVDRLIDMEMDFQLSILSAPEKTAEYHRVLNGTQILSGRIARVGGDIRITVSLFTYPDIERLPGGATRSVSNIRELFNIIPELVQQMQSEIEENQPPVNPFIGRWRATFNASNGSMLICILEFKNDGSIVVVRYDTNYRHRNNNNISSGQGSGSYSFRQSNNNNLIDISLTIYGTQNVFSSVHSTVVVVNNNPNQFIITDGRMQCESYYDGGTRVNPYGYSTFNKL